jgi:hypothetical protein
MDKGAAAASPWLHDHLRSNEMRAKMRAMAESGDPKPFLAALHADAVREGIANCPLADSLGR